VRAVRDELRVAVTDAASDPRVRVAAVGALVRGGTRTDGRWAWRRASEDPEASVRRRAAELTPALGVPAATPLLALLRDGDPLVVEAACWAAGEVAWPPDNRVRVVAAVVAGATHSDPLVREAAVAALGALGDPAGLPAVLAGCADRPAIRRRAVLALAPFAGPEVEAALAAALEDPDWQTRQAAEDLVVPGSD
jgi:HEAT repeat protein